MGNLSTLPASPGTPPRQYPSLAYDRLMSSEAARNAAHSNLSLIERIERALILLAYFIELDGDIYVPLFEKFESELADLKRAEAVRDRARRLLANYSREGGVKAMDSRNLRLSSSDGPFPYLGLPLR